MKQYDWFSSDNKTQLKRNFPFVSRIPQEFRKKYSGSNFFELRAWSGPLEEIPVQEVPRIIGHPVNFAWSNCKRWETY